MLCLAPGDWLIISQVLSGTKLHARLLTEIPEHGFALVDLSQALTTVRVAGRAARDLLSKGCGLDLHPRNFPDGRCARTRFAQIPLIIDCVGSQPQFELYAGGSYSSYLQSWLSSATAEFQEPCAT